MVVFLNFSSIPFEEDLIRKVVRFVFQKEKILDSELSVILVSKKRIRELNRKYRKENKVTDVLSFEGDKSIFSKLGLKPELGEIFICPEFITGESKREKINFKKEVSRVLIHGLLHLLGYNHIEKREANKMFEKQEDYLNTFWLRGYID